MQTRKHYTKEFKLEAIRLFDSGDLSASDVARQLDIRRNQLYKWKGELAEVTHQTLGYQTPVKVDEHYRLVS